jgi:hypothetical protein
LHGAAGTGAERNLGEPASLVDEEDAELHDHARR